MYFYIGFGESDYAFEFFFFFKSKEIHYFLAWLLILRPRLAPGSIDLHTHHFGPPLKKSNMTSEAYKNTVLEAKEHIQAGDIFQIVLSQRFERRTFADPFEVYRALRVVNPSPYMTYLQVCTVPSGISIIFCCTFWYQYSFYQARGCILVASSPEILTRVKKVNFYYYQFKLLRLSRNY